VGPIAFILVFLLIPLAAAVLAVGFYTALGIATLLAAVPTGLWAALTVGAGIAVAARLWVVLRTLRQGPAARNMP
jgi:hypothetical protein